MIPDRVVAFCPGHISGYFKRIDGDTIDTTGSIGAGIVISEGVTAIVEPADSTNISIHQSSLENNWQKTSYGSPILSDVLDKIGITATITTRCCLPIGSGFGLSAAALLSTLSAVNLLYNLGFSKREIAQYAHEAEVVHRTGLGDVAACQAGGMVVRKGPGIDAEIERRYNLAEPLYALTFGPIHTPSVLGSSDQMARVSSAFPECLPENLQDFFQLSYRFAEQSGLLTPEVDNMIRICNDHKVPASMTMLGNGVFAYGHRALDLLRPFGNVYELHVADHGPEIQEMVP
jgi:pantoate kinase